MVRQCRNCSCGFCRQPTSREEERAIASIAMALLSLNQTQSAHTPDKPPTYEEVNGIPPSYREASGLPPSYSVIFEKEGIRPPPSPPRPETTRTPPATQPTATTTTRQSPQSTRPSPRTTNQTNRYKIRKIAIAVGIRLLLFIVGLLFLSPVFAAIVAMGRADENRKLLKEMQHRMQQNKTSTIPTPNLEQALITTEKIVAFESYIALTESNTNRD